MIERRWWILSTVSVGTFMATIDGSIVNVSLPSIRAAFGVDLSAAGWVVVAYLLVVGSTLLPFGRLGELVGFRRVYLAGFATFTGASVLCAAAPDEVALVAFRAIQGAGAAMLMAMGPAVVARTFGPGERGRALGLHAISVSVGLSVGPTLGGILTELGSWRAIFLVNVPIGVFAYAWAWWILPRDWGGRTAAFDLPGATLVGTSLFALLFALTEGDTFGWSSPVIGGLVVAAVALGAAFVVVERRAAAPMFDLALFRIRAFTAGLASALIAYVSLMSTMFAVPFLLAGSGRFGPLEIGLLMTPIPLTTAFVAPLAGSLSDRIGSRAPSSLGLAVMAAGIALLTQLPPDFSGADLAGRLVVVGLGQGLFATPNSAAVLGAIPRVRMGTASGTVAEVRVVGQAVGIALAGAVIAIRSGVHGAGAGGAAGAAAAAAAATAQGAAIRDAFAVGAAICLAGVVTSLVRGGHRPGSPGPEAAPDAQPSAEAGESALALR